MQNKIQKTIFVVVGTRADAVKMMPVFAALQRLAHVSVKLISTGQHRDLLKDVFSTFGVQPDVDLDVMVAGQPLTDLTASIIAKFGNLLRSQRPDYVLVHGDTASSCGAGIAAFYEKVSVGHVEAGLRTNDLQTPFPEEFHRQILSVAADMHFAPSKEAQQNLIANGIEAEKIFVIGNTIADAISSVFDRKKSEVNNAIEADYSHRLRPSVLMTLHRRESQCQMQEILQAIAEAARILPHVDFKYISHPSFEKLAFVTEIFSNIGNVNFVPPMHYGVFISTLMHADLILTDLGGVQEEAAILNRPVLLIRDKTERLDGILEGTVRLIGKEPEMIKSALINHLKRLANPSPECSVVNHMDFGASARVAQLMGDRLSL
jgi:UDP-N-acetylglucosamine 2-epimerase (non-hydrolysing)